MIIAFVVIQAVLILFMALHDWVRAAPLNDIDALAKEDSVMKRLIGSAINTGWVLVPFIVTLVYFPGPYPEWATGLFLAFYVGLTAGTILSWWIPYFFGSSPEHKRAFRKFAKTHHCLPPIKDHVVPNTLHILLHLQVWACLGISIALRWMS
ncbi:MAG: hypothetical protein AB7M93_30845 [Candidatus Obscuribacterales bacterium]